MVPVGDDVTFADGEIEGTLVFCDVGELEVGAPVVGDKVIEGDVGRDVTGGVNVVGLDVVGWDVARAEGESDGVEVFAQTSIPDPVKMHSVGAV